MAPTITRWPTGVQVRFQASAKRVDDAHRLVTQNQPRLDRVFAADDVDVCPTNRRRGDANDRLARTRRTASALLRRQLRLGPLNTTACIMFIQSPSPAWAPPLSRSTKCRRTLSVTMQKRLKSSGSASRRGRSWSNTSGASSTSMPLIRNRPCSLRATCATTSALMSIGSRRTLRRQIQSWRQGSRRSRRRAPPRRSGPSLRRVEAARRTQSGEDPRCRETSPRIHTRRE